MSLQKHTLTRVCFLHVCYLCPVSCDPCTHASQSRGGHSEPPCSSRSVFVRPPAPAPSPAAAKTDGRRLQRHVRPQLMHQFVIVAGGALTLPLLPLPIATFTKYPENMTLTGESGAFGDLRQTNEEASLRLLLLSVCCRLVDCQDV